MPIGCGCPTLTVILNKVKNPAEGEIKILHVDSPPVIPREHGDRGNLAGAKRTLFFKILLVMLSMRSEATCLQGLPSARINVATPLKKANRRFL